MNMNTSFLILSALLCTATIIAYLQGGWQRLITGFKQGLVTLSSMWWRLLLGFLLGGFVQVLIPRGLIAQWLGPESGVISLFIGSYAGLIMTGGAYVTMPVIASIYEAGAGAGPIIALLAASQMIRIQGLFVLHIPFFGARLAVTRFAICFILPPIIGLAGNAVFELITAV